jgi:MFS family permease
VNYAAGFLVRPFGALVFGRIGDLVGRKYTFLVTITVMGLSTFLGRPLADLHHDRDARAAAAPLLRLAQGLALGGEYGGRGDLRRRARSGEQARGAHRLDPDHRDGRALPGAGDHLPLPATMSATSSSAWGWRIPFLLSIILLVISIYIRLKLNESPMFR